MENLSIFRFGFQEERTSLLSKHFILLLLAFLLSFTHFLFKWFNHTPKYLPPSPTRLPIIGNLHQIGSNPHGSLKSLAQKYGPVMLIQAGNKPLIIISSADAAQEVLQKHELSFVDRPKPSFGGRLLYGFRNVAFSPYGEYWRTVRGICHSQLLSNNRVQSFRSIREEETAKMLENIRECSLSGSVIETKEVLSTLIENIVSLAAIGKRRSEERYGRNNKVKALVLDSNSIIGSVNLADYIPWIGWINHINGMEKKVSRVAKELDEYLENIVEQGILKRHDIIEEDERQQKNLLDFLLGLQRQENTTGFTLHRDSVKALIMEMVLIGTSSTYSLLEWAFSELLRNPEAMTKLQNEVRQIPDCSSRSLYHLIMEDHLGRLPYLKAVIKESLRLHPPSPFLPRASTEVVKIRGYNLAAGTELYINTWAVGRDPRRWEEAEEFLPERFLNSPADLKGKNFEFLPFGAGRRMCPGSGFALLIVELALANLIRNFNFTLADGIRPEELDMTEAHSVVTVRKNPLFLLASLAH